MKKQILNSMLTGMALFVAALSLQSCLNDDDDDRYTVCPNPNQATALVTLKTSSAGHLLLQLDDSTVLWPVNMAKSPYGDKEVRALINYRAPWGQEDADSALAGGMHRVYVNWVDSIRTKAMAPDRGAANDSVYGNDPLEIINDWTTVVEDGYLTLRFRTYFGNGKTHELNLVRGDSAYEVVLHHNAHGDLSGKPGDGLIAFRLDSLPDTEGKTVDLVVKWNSFSGKKSVKFKYRTRK